MIKIEKTIFKSGRHAWPAPAGKASSTNNHIYQTTKKKNIQLYETNLETQSRAYLLACHSGLQGVVLKHKPVK